MTEPTTPDPAPDSGASIGSYGARSLSGPPDASFVVPEQLRRRLGHGIDSVIWINEIGGVTVRGTYLGGPVYAKWAPPGSELDLAAEVDRLAWAGQFTAVPVVVDFFSDADGETLITRALPGENAVTPRWQADPETAVTALGSGLRALHDALPVADCPFDWSIRARIARSRAEGVPERLAGLDRLPASPPVEQLVVCHGDACAPNTVLNDDGSVSGYVDLGRMGVADRWADIAIGAWSTEWNYGVGYAAAFYDAYGVKPDPERIAFYRALWDAT